MTSEPYTIKTNKIAKKRCRERKRWTRIYVIGKLLSKEIIKMIAKYGGRIKSIIRRATEKVFPANEKRKESRWGDEDCEKETERINIQKSL